MGFASMSFFLYIVYELLVGLAAATAAEPNPEIAKKIGTAQAMTVISWCTYPIVYLFPMLGIWRQKPWCPSNWATVRPTLSRNAELALSSTRSLMPNPASSISCNEHVHDMASLAFASFSSRTDTFNFYR